MTPHGASRSRAASVPDGDRLELRLPARPDVVGSARRAVHDYLTARGVPSAVVDDLQLVTSELVTNGILHGSPGAIGVVVGIDDRDAIELRVSNDGPAVLPPVSTWQAPEDLVVRGRGLGIVRQLVDDAEVVEADEATTVVCRRAWRRGAAA